MSTSSLIKNLFFAVLLSFVTSKTALAQWTFSLSGTEDISHSGLNKVTDSKWTAGVSVYVLQYMSIGITHSQVQKATIGERQIGTTNVYEEFEDTVRIKSNGINISLILYSGRVTPYIFGGIMRKWYYYKWMYEESTQGEYRTYEPPENGEDNLWNAGIGLSIPVNYNFSIKIKRSWSEGKTLDSDTGEEDTVYDTYTEIGLTYKL